MPVMPAQLRVEPEIALVGDLGGVVGRHGDRHAFLGLDRLVQALAPVAVGHAAGRCTRR